MRTPDLRRRGGDVESLVNDRIQGLLDRRQFMNRALGLGLSVSAAGALLAACGSAGTGTTATSAPGGTLSIRLPTDMADVDPANWATFGDWTVMNAVYEGLVTFRPGTYERVNQLAKSFEISADGRRVDFTLKPGVQFHGGFGELTAEDVKFSYERAAALKGYKPTANEADWTGLKEVVVHDKYSGTILFSDYFAPILTSGLMGFDGFILSKKATETLGSKISTHPIGTGPYEFVQWTEGQSVTLKRFASYGGASSTILGARAPYDEIQLLVITDDNSASVALQSGSLDFGQIALPSVANFKANSSFRVFPVPTTDTWYLTMNVTQPKLKDIRVREAIRSAIDVPAIVQTAFLGLWKQANGMIAPTMPVGYWPGAPSHPRDVDASRALLKQAGVSGLSLELDYSTDPQADVVVSIIQSNLKDAGINAVLNKVDAASYYVASPATASRELSYWWLATSPDPFFMTEYSTCAQVNQWNWSHNCDPTFDQILSEASHALNRTKRQSLYEQAALRWDHNCTEVWIAWETNYFAGKSGIKPATTQSGNILPQYFS